MYNVQPHGHEGSVPDDPQQGPQPEEDLRWQRRQLSLQ
jgi:hypothetical protein